MLNPCSTPEGGAWSSVLWGENPEHLVNALVLGFPLAMILPDPEHVTIGSVHWHNTNARHLTFLYYLYTHLCFVDFVLVYSLGDAMYKWSRPSQLRKFHDSVDLTYSFPIGWDRMIMGAQVANFQNNFQVMERFLTCTVFHPLTAVTYTYPKSHHKKALYIQCPVSS